MMANWPSCFAIIVPGLRNALQLLPAACKAHPGVLGVRRNVGYDGLIHCVPQ